MRVSGLARALAASLGDCLVAWTVVHRGASSDQTGDRVDAAVVVDPDPIGQVMADRVTRSRDVDNGFLSRLTAKRDRAIVLDAEQIAGLDLAVLPDSWLDYLTAFPVRALALVPEHLDADRVGVLIVAARQRDAFDEGDQFMIRRAAVRLAGRVPEPVFGFEDAPSSPRSGELPLELLDLAPTALAVFDRSLRFVWMNAAMSDMNGIPRDQHIGLLSDEVSPLSGQLYEHHLVDVLKTGEPKLDVPLYAVIPEAGIERHWSASYVPWMVDGECQGVVAAVRDVTTTVVEQARSEAFLELSERLTLADDATSVADAAGAFLLRTFRSRAVVWLPLQGRIAAGDAVAALGFSDRAREWLDGAVTEEGSPLRAAADSGEPAVTPGRATVGDGAADTQWARWDTVHVAVPVSAGPGGRGLGALYVGWEGGRLVTADDLTVLETVSWLVGSALVRLAAQGAAEDARFRSALDAMIDQVAIASAVRDDAGVIVDFVLEFVNTKSIDGAGRGPAEMIGRRVLELYPEWTTTGMFERFVAVVDSGEPFLAERMHYRDVTDDGRQIDGWWSVQAARLDDGYIAASRDVTAVVEAEEAARAVLERVRAERTATELLQSAALPTRLPAVPSLRMGAAYRLGDPGQPVGGDWYDAFMLDDRRLALVIADVAGHGPRAATFMLQVRNVFRAIAIEHADPGEVLFRANDVTTQLNEPDGPFVTCLYAVVDVDTVRVDWAQAGHFSPLLLDGDGELQHLPARPGPPLAFFPGATYPVSTWQLRPADRMVLFTDGLFERRGEHIDAGLERLAAATHATRAHDAERAATFLADAVHPRLDDLAVLVVDVVAETRR
jgi:serine phosphatase RsbU (regulator of sigma subunit)